MPESDDYKIPPEQERLNEIFLKVFSFQHSLSDGRAVELEELRSKGILSPDDMAFLSAHSVTYKPHRVGDFHAIDMFHMPTADGGCIFTGPGGPPLTKRHAPLNLFSPIIESFLILPRPKEELLLNIEFTEHDGMGVSPTMIGFTLRTAEWRQRLPAMRSVAAESGFHPLQDEEVQGSWSLTFSTVPDSARTATAVVALLSRGCGFANETEITYSAGVLDEEKPRDPADPAIAFWLKSTYRVGWSPWWLGHEGTSNSLSSTWLVVRLIFCGIGAVLIGIRLALQGNGNWIWSGFFIGSILGLTCSALLFFGLVPLVRYIWRHFIRRKSN